MQISGSSPIRILIITIFLAGAALTGCGQPDPATRIASAKEKWAQHDRTTATILLKMALQAEPNNGEARYLLGAIHNELRDGTTAETELRRAQQAGYVGGGRVVLELGKAMVLNRAYDKALKETVPSPAFEDQAVAGIHALRGRAHLYQGQVADAQAEFDKAEKVVPGLPEAALGHIAIKWLAGDATAATDQLDQLLAKNPSYFDAWLLSGDLYRARLQPEKAIAAYQRATDLVPSLLSPRISRASLLIEASKLEEAQKAVDEMKKVGRNNPLVHYLQGLILFRHAKYRAANDSVLAGLKIAPDFPPLLLLSGVVSLSLGAFQQAERDLTKFLRTQPGNIYARRLLATALTSMNQGKRALEVLEPIFQQETQDATLLALMGHAEMSAGDYGRAIVHLDSAVKVNPGSAALRHNLAMARLSGGDTERAIEDLTAASELTPDNIKSDVVLAMTLMNQGQYDKALEAVGRIDKKVPNNALVHNMLGAVYMGLGDAAGARKAFEKSISLDPKGLRAPANLALLDIQEGKPEQARARFEKLLAADKNNLSALMALGGMAARAGRMADAEQYLNRAIQVAPASMRPRTVLVELYLATGQSDKALKAAQEAERATKGSAEALGLLGRVQVNAAHGSDAISTLEKLTNVAPNSARAHFELASARMIAKAPGAEAEFLRALRLTPYYPDALRGLVTLLVTTDRTAEALKLAEQTQRKYPKSSLGYLLEGDILLRQEKYPAALKSFEKGQRIEPSEQIATRMFVAETTSGNVAGALARLDKWVEQHPADTQARRMLADGYLQTGKGSAAAKHYQVLLERNPADAMVMNNLAGVLHEMKDARALELAQKAYELDSRNPRIADTLGWLLLGQGKDAQALQLLEKAAAQAPDAAVIRYHYAAALAKAGKKDKARAELEKALASKTRFAEREQAAALLKSL